MADSGEIVEEPRSGTGNGLSHDEEKDGTYRRSTERRRSKNRLNPNEPWDPAQASRSEDYAHEDKWKEGESVGWDAHPRLDRPKLDALPVRDDHRGRFYNDYRKLAEEYDRGFLKKHDEDLNITLIFAGLFSAVASAFIIQLITQLQPDPGDETAALLRVLIYKIDNTTFGNNIPTLPQWTGPPRAVVDVLAILFASLAISLFSAFLAMLGKQWLTRYSSADNQGSAIERCQNRQLKLDGITAWYFRHMMESLPLMLQAALVLLGCALSRYLWGVDPTIATVILVFTSFGIIFYLFIFIAGTAFDNCPYQIPASRFFRQHILPVLQLVPSLISFVFSPKFPLFLRSSACYSAPFEWWESLVRPWYSPFNILFSLSVLLYMLLIAPATDIYNFGRWIFRSLVAFGEAMYRWFSYTRFRPFSVVQQTSMLDLRCISWILQTSLDKDARLSSLHHLTLMPELVWFHPTLIVDCFKIFAGCVNVNNGKVAVVRGLEELAVVSANGFFRTFRYLSAMDPTSGTLEDLRRRYNMVFPPDVDFTDLPFHSTMTMIHTFATRFGNPHDVRWNDRRLSIEEHIPLARQMAEAAQEKYQQTQQRKVPRWILRFALYSLSLGPISPVSIITDSLTIIATDLGCDVSDIRVSEKENARVEQLTRLIIQKLDTVAEAASPDLVFEKRKAINTLLPYAIHLEQGGQQELLNAVFRAARTSNSMVFIWRRVELYISRLFMGSSSASLNRVITLISPYAAKYDWESNQIAIATWAAAASAIPYTEEVGQSVVDTLFQIVSHDGTARIPIEIWGLLKRQPSLPPWREGLWWGGILMAIDRVQRLGDIEILKSFFLVVWSEWYSIPRGSLAVMKNLMREEFGGIGMGRHRRDLIERLDHVLEQLDRGLQYLKEHKPTMTENEMYGEIRDYGALREVLLEVDREAANNLV